MNSFWRLPGPASYVEKIHYDLTDCCNVIAILNGITPEGILFELQDAVERSGISWERIYREPNGEPPVTWLASHCGEELPWSATPVDFHRLKAAAGKAFVIEMPYSKKVLDEWCTFIVRFAQACRADNNILSPRMLLLWPHHGGNLPGTDLRLKVHQWTGTVESTDIHLLAALLLRNTQMSSFYRNLAAALAAKLSGGDPILCQKLCSLSLPEMMMPQELLSEYAHEMGWHPTMKASEDIGSLIRIDGIQKEHPAFVVLQGRSKEIDPLIWGAQIGVLMPLLEERRQEIIEKLRDDLYLSNHQQDRYAAKDVEDLEIGQISYQVNFGLPRISLKLKDQIARLKTIRDYLAHRRVVPADFLLDEDTVRALHRPAKLIF